MQRITLTLMARCSIFRLARPSYYLNRILVLVPKRETLSGRIGSLAHIRRSGFEVVAKPKFRLLMAGVVFMTLSIVVSREFLFGNSFFIHRDVIWPYADGNLLADLVYSTDLDFTRRLAYLGPFFAAAQGLGLSSLVAEKLLFLFTHFFIGLFAYLGVYGFLSSKSQQKNQNLVFYISLFAGVFYLFNPIGTTMVSTTFAFALSYALIPLVFYFFDKTLNKQTFGNVFVLSILVALSVAATIHYIVLIPLFLLLPWLVVFILEKKTQKSHNIIKPIAYTVLFTSLLAGLFSIYWILPALSFSLEDISLRPTYALTYETLHTMSQGTTLVDVFRLMGDWWPRLDLVPIAGQSVWMPLTFSIPICMVAFILLSRGNSKLGFYFLSFSIITLLLIFFNKGTQPPFGELYQALYSIPSISWLFRVPSKFAMMLAFYVTMVITLGFFNLYVSVLRSRQKIVNGSNTIPKGILNSGSASGSTAGSTSSSSGSYISIINAKAATPDNGHSVLPFRKEMTIKDILRPLLLVFFIVCVCLISWPMFTGDFGGIYHNNQYPDIWPPRGIHISNPVDATLPEQNMLVAGDLDKLVSLNQLDSFSQRKSSIVFADESAFHNLYNLTATNKVIIDDTVQNLMMHFLPKDSAVIKPFEYTKSHSPNYVWSRAGTSDPAYAPFHKYLDLFGIKNSDLDYGHGLVFTSAKDVLDIPIQIQDSGTYDVYLRYMKNEEGGTMKVYLENMLIDIIHSKDELPAKFVWKKIGKMDLENGRQTISIENVNGLNAVNVFVLIPTDKVPNMLSSIYETVNKSRNIEILEAESDFVSSGRKNGEKQIFNEISGTSTRSFAGQIQVPENSTQMSLQFMGKQNPNSQSVYKIKSFEIDPIPATTRNDIVTADFEPSSGRARYYTTNSAYLILSSETQNQISGSQSIRIDISQSESELWNTLSTDFLPVTPYGNLTYNLSVNAQDVNSFHSKVVYYDKNKLPISSNTIFFKEKDGTFSDTNSRSQPIPEGTNYIRHQFLVKTNPDSQSHFIVDNVKITQVSSDKPLKNDFSIFGNSYVEENYDVAVHDKDIQINFKRGNATDPIIFRSSPIDVSMGVSYNYKLDIETYNIDSLSSRIDYSVEDVEKSSRYGVQDGVLILGPNSQISTSMDVLKPSNYTIAVRLNTCEECSLMAIRVGDNVYKELSLQNNNTEFRWLYLTTPLNAGNTDLTIYSNDETELDKLIVYSGTKEENIENLFSQVNVPDAASHITLNQTKISPMKYEIEASSTRPFILRLMEPYNPMWSVRTNEKEYQPIPVYFESTQAVSQNIVSMNYPAVNGFIVNETGKISMTIEYKTIEWLYLGIIISSIAFIMSVVYLVLRRMKIVSPEMLINPIMRISPVRSVRTLLGRKHG
jgi:hypothetical protein